MEALREVSNDSYSQPAAVVPLERAGSNGRSVANTQAALLLCLLFIVLLRQRAEFCRVLLLYSASFAVELLDVVQPRDAAGDLPSHASVIE
jgi:hypothetical protein